LKYGFFFTQLMQTLVHYSLHFLAVGLIAYLYDKKNWKRNWLILVATMLVDLDHLLAVPIFAPNRCSIGFHPLHSEVAIATYILGIIFTKNKILRLIFIGLLFHMITDFIDCLWMFSKCSGCYENSEVFKWFKIFRN